MKTSSNSVPPYERTRQARRQGSAKHTSQDKKNILRERALQISSPTRTHPTSKTPDHANKSSPTTSSNSVPPYERSHAPTPQTSQEDPKKGLRKCTLQLNSPIRTHPTNKTPDHSNKSSPMTSSNSVPPYERSHAPTPQTPQEDPKKGLGKCTLQLSSPIRTHPTSKTQNHAEKSIPTTSSNSVPNMNAATRQHHKRTKKTLNKDFTSAPCNSVPTYERNRQARHKIKQTSFYQQSLPTPFHVF